MSEQQPFVRIQVTYELNLYYGRVAKPYAVDGNWLLFLKDQFTTAWINSEMLRPGEYIHVVDAKVLPPE